MPRSYATTKYPGSGGGTPAGIPTNLQYNLDGTHFGAIPDSSWDGTSINLGNTGGLPNVVINTAGGNSYFDNFQESGFDGQGTTFGNTLFARTNVNVQSNGTYAIDVFDTTGSGIDIGDSITGNWRFTPAGDSFLNSITSGDGNYTFARYLGFGSGWEVDNVSAINSSTFTINVDNSGNGGFVAFADPASSTFFISDDTGTYTNSSNTNQSNYSAALLTTNSGFNAGLYLANGTYYFDANGNLLVDNVLTTNIVDESNSVYFAAFNGSIWNLKDTGGFDGNAGQVPVAVGGSGGFVWTDASSFAPPLSSVLTAGNDATFQDITNLNNLFLNDLYGTNSTQYFDFSDPGQLNFWNAGSGIVLTPSGNFSGLGTVSANVFQTTGGTSADFVKGDGSLDSSTYLNQGSLPFLGPTILFTTTGINAKVTGNYPSYNPPIGFVAVVTGYVVRVTAASSISSGATLGLGTSSGSNDISAAQAMTGLTATTQSFQWTVNGLSVPTTHSTNIYINVTAGATGTSQTIVVDVIGYLI